MVHLPVIQENATTLNDLIDISCRKYRDLPAIGMALEEPLSYTALHERILALAAHLHCDHASSLLTALDTARDSIPHASR